MRQFNLAETIFLQMVTKAKKKRTQQLLMNGNHLLKDSLHQDNLNQRERGNDKQQRLIEMIRPISGNRRVFNSQDQTKNVPFLSHTHPVVFKRKKNINSLPFALVDDST